MTDVSWGMFPGSQIFFLSFYVLIGLCLGSFASVLAHRIPSRVSWSALRGCNARSACPVCRHVLCWKDLIPLLSWARTRGKCAYCGAPVGWSYPALEGLCGILALFVGIGYGMTVPSLFLLAMIPVLSAMIVIDLRHQILPDVLSGAFFLLGLAFVWSSGMPVSLHFLASLYYAGLIYALGWLTGRAVGKPALGMGDVKLVAGAGLILGAQALPFFMCLSGAGGLVTGLLFMYALKKTGCFPFGPALILSFWVLLFL